MKTWVKNTENKIFKIYKIFKKQKKAYSNLLKIKISIRILCYKYQYNCLINTIILIDNAYTGFVSCKEN